MFGVFSFTSPSLLSRRPNAFIRRLVSNIYLFQNDDYFPPNCGELSEYTDSAHTEVEDLCSKCMNILNVYDQYEHNTRRIHASYTVLRGQPISKNQPDSIKHNRDDRIVVVVAKRKNVLVDIWMGEM